MNADDVIICVRRGQSRCDVAGIVQELVNVPGDIIFNALFPIAIREQAVGSGPVALSAYVLYSLNPTCGFSVEEAVSSLLDSWDISIEEVPWYLANQFGRDAVLESVGKIRAEQTDPTVATRLRVIEYWVRLNPQGV